MEEILIQVLATFALVLGIIGGEIASTKAFGILKKSWMYLVEILVFVVALVILLDNFAITELNSSLIILFYFFTGCITIIAIRAGMTGFGIVSEQIKEKIIKVRKEKDYIVGLRKALKRRGFETKEMKRIAKEVGFKKEKIEDVFGYWEE